MDKKALWNIFMKTGKVSDYLRYKNAREISIDDPYAADTEAADEFYVNPNTEEPDYDDFDGWYNN